MWQALNQSKGRIFVRGVRKIFDSECVFLFYGFYSDVFNDYATVERISYRSSVVGVLLIQNKLFTTDCSKLDFCFLQGISMTGIDTVYC